MEKKIVCQRCTYFFVTWQNSAPYGCKAYGFKSKQIPAVVVRQSSGVDCQFFNEKPKKSS